MWGRTGRGGVGRDMAGCVWGGTGRGGVGRDGAGPGGVGRGGARRCGAGQGGAGGSGTGWGGTGWGGVGRGGCRVPTKLLNPLFTMSLVTKACHYGRRSWCGVCTGQSLWLVVLYFIGPLLMYALHGAQCHRGYVADFAIPGIQNYRRHAVHAILACPAPPPLCPSTPKIHKNDRQTGSCAETSPCLHATRGTKRTYVAGNLPVPHPHHNCCNRPLQYYVQANLSMFWRSSLSVKGISSCGIEALSNLAPHLEQLHMLALWGRLWSRLGFRF